MGGGPILLTCSFPYVRGWLNNYPFRNQPEARVICSLYNGSPVKNGIHTALDILLPPTTYSLPEFALKKKVRWSTNSKQLARYIKRRMGNNLKMQILQREGIELDDRISKPKQAIMSCPRCSEANPRENKFCSKCSYSLVPEVYDELKKCHYCSTGPHLRVEYSPFIKLLFSHLVISFDSRRYSAPRGGQKSMGASRLAIWH